MGPENRPHPHRPPLSTAPGHFQGHPAIEAIHERSRMLCRRGFWGLRICRNHIASPFQRPKAISRARTNLLDCRLRRRWDGWSICRLAPKGLASDLRPAKFMAIPKPGRGPRFPSGIDGTASYYPYARSRLTGGKAATSIPTSNSVSRNPRGPYFLCFML